MLQTENKIMRICSIKHFQNLLKSFDKISEKQAALHSHIYDDYILMRFDKELLLKCLFNSFKQDMHSTKSGFERKLNKTRLFISYTVEDKNKENGHRRSSVKNGNFLVF